MPYAWDFSVVWRSAPLLLLGLLGTLKVTAAALVLGLPLGLGVALLRLSRARAVSLPAGVFVEFFRSTPPLVQLFWCFFALPLLIGVRIDSFQAAVMTLSVQSSAFFAEVFRGGIVSIERGQWEAGRALGMSHRQLLQRVVLPQAIKRMIPAFLERAIELMKTTTLVSTVAYADLLFEASDIAQKTFRPLEVFTAAAGLYFVIIFLASRLVQVSERRLARSGESTAH
jgi:polar amino acid transport system permease protein